MFQIFSLALLWAATTSSHQIFPSTWHAQKQDQICGLIAFGEPNQPWQKMRKSEQEKQKPARKAKSQGKNAKVQGHSQSWDTLVVPHDHHHTMPFVGA